MVTYLPVSKTLIEYDNNNSKENKEEEIEPIHIECTNQKVCPENDEIAIDFRWSGVQEEDNEDITKVKFIESLQKQTNKENLT